MSERAAHLRAVSSELTRRQGIGAADHTGTRARKTAVLILAAGSSRRLGHPKQLVCIGGQTLLERAWKTAMAAALGPVAIVLNPAHGAVLTEAYRLGCQIILNEEADEGVASSIRAGVRVVQGSVSGALLTTCDQLTVTAPHLRRLVELSEDNILCSAYSGHRGVPAWFPSRNFPNLLMLEGDTGARELLRNAQVLDLPGGDLDLDTQDDLRRAKAEALGRFVERAPWPW